MNAVASPYCEIDQRLKPAQRLVVAADLRGTNIDQVGQRVLALAEKIANTGVVIKVNSLLRAWGYDLIESLHGYGLEVFADLKLPDIPNTCECDAEFLSGYSPELLTIMCNAGSKAMESVRNILPKTEILGVTVLTSMNQNDCSDVHGEPNILAVVNRLAKIADSAGIQGLVCAPKEVRFLHDHFPHFTLNTPNVTLEGSEDTRKDQNKARQLTVQEAIATGATRVIVGRAILNADDPKGVVTRVIDAIEEGLSRR